MPQEPSGPPVLKITVISGAVSLCLMMMYHAFRYIMDDSIRTEEDVEAHLGLHVLAVIPNSERISKQNSTVSGKAQKRK